MADRLGILGQLACAATTEEIVYTVPARTQTTTSTITVCNRTASGVAYRLYVAVGGEAVGDKQYLRYDKTVAANDSDDIIIGATLEEGDEIRFYAASADLSVNVFGVETS